MPQDTIIAAWILGIAFAIVAGLLIKFRHKVKWRAPPARHEEDAPWGVNGTRLYGGVDAFGCGPGEIYRPWDRR